MRFSPSEALIEVVLGAILTGFRMPRHRRLVNLRLLQAARAGEVPGACGSLQGSGRSRQGDGMRLLTMKGSCMRFKELKMMPFLV